MTTDNMTDPIIRKTEIFGMPEPEVIYEMCENEQCCEQVPIQHTRKLRLCNKCFNNLNEVEALKYQRKRWVKMFKQIVKELEEAGTDKWFAVEHVLADVRALVNNVREDEE